MSSVFGDRTLRLHYFAAWICHQRLFFFVNEFFGRFALLTYLMFFPFYFFSTLFLN